MTLPVPLDQWVRRHPDAPRRMWVVGRLAIFVWVSILLTFPDIGKVRSHIAGNPGDAFLVFALLRWGADRSTSLYSGYWDGPMFSTGHDVMAYTETFLPLTAPFRLVEAVTGSPIVAMNVLYLAAWALCAECTYLLLCYLTKCRSASFVGSLAFTFATIRLAQTGHYQLVFAFCIPLAFLILFKLLDHPSPWLGVALGLVMSCQFLTTAYYGLVLITSIGAVSLVALVRRRHRDSFRATLLGLAACAVVLAVLVLPVAMRYSSVQSGSHLRDAYPGQYALRLGDLRAAAPLSSHMNRFDFLENHSSSRSGENFAYLGFFVFVLTPVAIAAAIFSARFRRAVTGPRRWALATLVVSGLYGFGIAIGRGPILGVSMPFYDMARRVVPGVKSMLAIVRLFVFTQLALTVLATLALVWLLGWLPSRIARLALCGILSVLIVYESSSTVPIVRVPTVHTGSLYQIIDDQSEGVVAELPITPRGLGATYAFLEATRMLLNSGDGHQTVNGYSGFAPQDYDGVVDSLNRLPAADSVHELRNLDVRYLMIHTTPIDTGLDPVSDLVNDSGYAYMSQAQAESLIAGLPPGTVERRIDASDGIVLVLTRSD